MRAAAALILLSATPAVALPPCTSIIYVQRPGDVRCEGQLVPDPVLARLLAKRQAKVAACEREAAAAIGLKDAEIDLCEDQLTSERTRADAIERACDKALSSMPSPVVVEQSVWRSPWLWGTIGIALGAAAGYGVRAMTHGP